MDRSGSCLAPSSDQHAEDTGESRSEQVHHLMPGMPMRAIEPIELLFHPSGMTSTVQVWDGDEASGRHVLTKVEQCGPLLCSLTVFPKGLGRGSTGLEWFA